MKIRLYTVIGCKSCLLVKAFLANRNISFEIIDADANLETAIVAMKNAGTEQLPIVEYFIDDEPHYIIGYDSDNLDKLIKLC